MTDKAKQIVFLGMIASLSLSYVAYFGYALFWDSEGAKNAFFSAGTIDLSLEAGQTLENNEHWLPGSEGLAEIVLSNQGSLPLGDIEMETITRSQN